MPHVEHMEILIGQNGKVRFRWCRAALHLSCLWVSEQSKSCADMQVVSCHHYLHPFADQLASRLLYQLWCACIIWRLHTIVAQSRDRTISVQYRDWSWDWNTLSGFWECEMQSQDYVNSQIAQNIHSWQNGTRCREIYHCKKLKVVTSQNPK